MDPQVLVNSFFKQSEGPQLRQALVLRVKQTKTEFSLFFLDDVTVDIKLNTSIKG